LRQIYCVPKVKTYTNINIWTEKPIYFCCQFFKKNLKKSIRLWEVFPSCTLHVFETLTVMEHIYNYKASMKVLNFDILLSEKCLKSFVPLISIALPSGLDMKRYIYIYTIDKAFFNGLQYFTLQEGKCKLKNFFREQKV